MTPSFFARKELMPVRMRHSGQTIPYSTAISSTLAETEAISFLSSLALWRG